MFNNQVFEHRNFFSPNQCDKLIQKKYDYHRSKIIKKNAIVTDLNMRKSWTTYPDYNYNLEYLDWKINMHMFSLYGTNHSSLLQITKYHTGNYFNEHSDALYDDQIDKLGPQRLWTCLVYLNDDFEGGNTIFPYIDYECTPQTGKLICWKNLDSSFDRDPSMVHKSEPVTQGSKYILTKLFYV